MEFRFTAPVTRKLHSDAPSTVGGRIRAESSLQGLKRKDLVRLTKIPYSTLAEIENDRQKWSTRLHAIAAAFPKPVRVEWLADGTLPKYADDPRPSSASAASPQAQVFYQLCQIDFDALPPDQQKTVRGMLLVIEDTIAPHKPAALRGSRSTRKS